MLKPELELEPFIANLYAASANGSHANFRKQALHLLHNVIPYDAALWATGSFELRNFHTAALINLPKDFSQNLINSHSINPIIDELYKHPGEAVDISDSIDDRVFFESKVYQRCFEPYGIERILSSAHLQERSGIFTILTLYRKDRQQPFTTAEKRVHNRALYHLLSAASQSNFLHLKQQHLLKPTNCAAVCDQHGFIYEIEPSCVSLLDSTFPDRAANKIPLPIQLGEQQSHAELNYTSTALGDLFCIEMWPKTLLDLLTSREREVVEGIGNGLTFKEIAKQLNLSPSTVSNHLYRVYNKLEINSRSELAEILNN